MKRLLTAETQRLYDNSINRVSECFRDEIQGIVNHLESIGCYDELSIILNDIEANGVLFTVNINRGGESK